MELFDSFTIIACCVILAAFIAAWRYIANTSDVDLAKRRKWIEQLPSIISTLGVLGTFLGITKGLVSFNTATLDKSIPILLGGLKTAFFTSLLGMTGSLILNRIVSAKFDKEQKKSETEKAARMIIDAMNANQRELPKLFKDSNENLVSTLSKDETVKVIRQDVEQLKDDIEEIKGLTQEMMSALAKISTSNSTVAEELPRLRAVAVTATASLSAIDNNVHDIEEAVSTINGNVSDMTEGLEKDLEEVKTSLSSMYERQDEIKDAITEIDIHNDNDEEEEEW